jgi:prepilin-type N-terminal cleavage/methylation domain-containing protein
MSKSLKAIRAFSGEVDAGSPSENAIKQTSRASFRFNQNGKRSKGQATSGRQAGFTLVETLVALAIASIFLGVLTRGFITAWSTTGISSDTLRSVMIARSLATNLRQEGQVSASEGTIQGFRFTIETAPLDVEKRDAPFPPPPQQALNAARPPAGTPPTGAPPTSSPPLPPPKPLRVSIIVTSPSGRTLHYETSTTEKAAP